ncbi:T9SS type A sorting domain-containing protein [Chryseobacterium zhengzhouense]|uniref:T9SS type A sorting domain-containing protein n=1 Tax=Chryseobacterium zhengzhouense TaxID=1636086 RepID=A0ABW2M129_9FLAO
MRTKLFYIAFFLSANLFLSQNINFADVNFKNALLPYHDVNGDGQISVSEAQNATAIFIDTNNNITNLAGIEYYTNLTTLMIKNNPITAPVDLSQNTQLQNVRLGFGTAVTSANLTGLTQLKYLNIGLAPNTPLNVLNKPLLEEIIIEGTPSGGLSTIDVSQNPVLKKLWINNNNLTSINVTQNPLLEELVLQKNTNITTSILTLDVSQNPALKILNIGGHTMIPSINVSSNPALERLFLGSTAITSLNLTNNTLLKFLDITNDNFANGINLQNQPLLEEFHASTANLPNLDLSNNSNLQAISIINNYIPTINVSHLSQLYRFDAGNNLFTSIDLSNNPNLKYVNFLKNQLMKYINLKNGFNQNIIWLSDSDYQLMPQLQGICVDNPASTYAIKVKQAVGANVLVTSNCSLLSTQENQLTLEKPILFPIPTKDLLNIKTKESLVEYSIFSLSGQKVQSGEFLNNERYVNVENLLPGIYFIKIKTDKNSYTEKFTKK